MVVSRLGIDPDSAGMSFLAWRCDAQLSFTIRGLPWCDARAAVLSAMVQAKAFPTSGCQFLVPAGSAEDATLLDLEAHGF
eukprot:13510826-Alexandrium_andersonii.AAC.1